MKNDLPVKNGITIPAHELEITASRSGGPGGQHVNKSSTRITVRWNINTTNALTEEQKLRVLEKLHSRLTSEGDLIIHNSSSRSQLHNKQMALTELAQQIKKALYVPKQRLKTKASKSARESRLQSKTHRGAVKKMRSKKHYDE